MRQYRRYIIAILTVAVGLGALWLYKMQYIALALDTVVTRQLEATPLSNVAWNGIYLIADHHMLDLDLPDEPATSARVKPDSAKRLVLVNQGERAVFGRGTSQVINDEETIKPATVFALEPGDHLSLSVEQSWFPWPTFFEVNYMTGNTTTWRRYRYYRLTLRKVSGSLVEMLWRYEEFYYPSEHDWVKGDRLCEANEPPCGLVAVRVRTGP